MSLVPKPGDLVKVHTSDGHPLIGLVIRPSKNLTHLLVLFSYDSDNSVDLEWMWWETPILIRASREDSRCQ